MASPRRKIAGGNCGKAMAVAGRVLWRGGVKGLRVPLIDPPHRITTRHAWLVGSACLFDFSARGRGWLGGRGLLRTQLLSVRLCVYVMCEESCLEFAARPQCVQEAGWGTPYRSKQGLTTRSCNGPLGL